MKQMIYRQTTYQKGQATVRRREYLKQSKDGWTWLRKFEAYTFKNHNDAKEVIGKLRQCEHFKLGIEPIDNLNYAIIS